MDDHQNSSNLEFEPAPSKTSGETPGLASIAKSVKDAESNHISSKKTVKQLQHGHGGAQHAGGAEDMDWPVQRVSPMYAKPVPR